MRVIQIANRPRAAGAGGDVAVDRTAGLLRSYGLKVLYITKSSQRLDRNLAGKAKAFFGGIHSRASAREMAEHLVSFRPDVVHAHNLFPCYSPSVLAVCKRARIPVVMTLHSFFLICPTTFHFRNGRICELCCGGREFWCMLTNCRGNMPESAAYSVKTAIARLSGSYIKNVNVFIALTEFARDRFVAEGISEDQIVIVPNMCPDQELLRRVDKEKYIAFVGRLSAEKGCDLLLSALSARKAIKAKVAGDGPLKNSLEELDLPNVEFLGWLERDQVPQFMFDSRAVVLPSRCFEMSPLAVLEAMACGKPVIAPRLGGIPEIVRDHETGLLFEPNNPLDLAEKIDEIWANDQLALELGENAHRNAVERLGAAQHFRALISVYQQAINMVG